MKSIEGFKLFDGQEVQQWVDMVADGNEGAEGESMEVDAQVGQGVVAGASGAS